MSDLTTGGLILDAQTNHTYFSNVLTRLHWLHMAAPEGSALALRARDAIPISPASSNAGPSPDRPSNDRPATRHPLPCPAPAHRGRVPAPGRGAPEAEWFANITNVGTCRVYKRTISELMAFTGIVRPEEFRTVIRAHAIAWRDTMTERGLDGSTIRNRLATLSSLFEYMCERNAVAHNPVEGVKRPKVGSSEGKTPPWRSPGAQFAGCSCR